MPAPFLPSLLAHNTSPLLVADPVQQPVSVGAHVGQRRPDERNPLFLTRAEEVQSVAPFLARNMRKEQADPKVYTVLPGGRTAYTPAEAERRRYPTPDDWPHDATLGNRAAENVATILDHRRDHQVRGNTTLVFPPDAKGSAVQSVTNQALAFRR